MREIKFRAWDTYKRQIIECGGIGSLILSEIAGLDEEYPLMQYTGLKDKNGNEIYEGDILFYCLKKGWEVFFEEGFYYMMRDNDSYILEKTRAMISEIIGNIYKNPELLEGK